MPTPVTSADVDAAIAQVLSGGELVKLPNGQEFRASKLSELQALRERLKAEELAASSGGGFQKITFRRPT